MKTNQQKRQYVYCYYDEGDNPLYVGISHDVFQRAVQHSERQAWWPSVSYVQLFMPAPRLNASRVETILINYLRPMHNKSKVLPMMLDRYKAVPKTGRIYRYYIGGIKFRISALKMDAFKQLKLMAA